MAAHPTRGLNLFLALANGPNAGTSHPAATAAVEIPNLFDIKVRLAPLPPVCKPKRSLERTPDPEFLL